MGRDRSAEAVAGTGREIEETEVGTEGATGERGGAQDLGREIGGRQRGHRERERDKRREREGR